MTGEIVKVDLSALDSLSDQLRQFSQDVMAIVASVEAEVSQLHVVWTGAAAEEHNRAHREWAQGAQQMIDGAEHMRKASEATHAAFRTVMQSNKALFS